MADGATTLTLTEELSAVLERRAAAVGMSGQELAEQLLTQSLFDYDDYTWIGDDPRDTPVDETDGDVSGGRPWEEVKRDLRAQLEARLAAKT
jgi:3-deoxy-D-manno-octulosonate 8-phosphate phosphatase KdsC-like HAD superfamily phosphatase